MQSSAAKAGCLCQACNAARGEKTRFDVSLFAGGSTSQEAAIPSSNHPLPALRREPAPQDRDRHVAHGVNDRGTSPFMSTVWLAAVIMQDLDDVTESKWQPEQALF